MATVTSEQSFIIQEEALLDKTPVSTQIQDTIDALSSNDAMEAEESEEELDLHVCGKCKAEFTSIQDYIDHKLVCSKASPAKAGSHDTPQKAKRRHNGKQIITSTSAVTAIMEPQEQSFCETVLEEGVIADDTGSDEAHQEIVKAAQASENQDDDDKEKDDSKRSKLLVNSKKGTITSEGETSSEATAGQAFKCTVCDKEFDRPETLVVHQFMHKKFHQCADCKRSFVSEENLSKHKREFKHVFKCRICREEFPSQEVRKTHETTHTRQHECGDCKKKFYTEKTLERHRDKVQHNLPCDTCGKLCRDKHALNKHQESHMRVKSHVCDYDGCPRGFRTASELAKHKKCVHLGIKDHKCDECGKEFARKDKLNRHLLIHSPNRPTYPCPFKTFTGCAKTFYRKDKLQRHIFAHSKEKPYKCDTCSKLFARKDNLTEHTRIHTGEFKHRCPVCNKGMGGPKKMLLHVQQKHSGANEIIPEKPTMVACCLPSSSEVATITTATADASAASWVEESMAEAKQEDDMVKDESGSEMAESFNTDQIEEESGQPEGVQQHHLQGQPLQQHLASQAQHPGQQQPKQQHQHDSEHSQQQQQQQQQQPQLQQHVLPQQAPSQQQPKRHQHDNEQSQQQQQQHHQQVLQQHIIQQQQQAPPQQQHEPRTPPSRPPPPLQQQQQQQQPHALQSQTMVVHPSQVPPTTMARVAVHYLANNTSPGQSRGHYVSGMHQGGQNVTQSETALLHEVLSELATRSLFNS